MRKFLLFAAAAMALLSCNQDSDVFTVNVELEDTEGKWLTLVKIVDRKPLVIDSVLVEAGIPAVLSGSVESVQNTHLAVKGERASLTLLLENAEYNITGSLAEPVIETKAFAQSEMNAYEEDIKGITEKVKAAIEAYYEVAPTGDKVKIDSVLNEYYALNDEKSAYDSTYIAEHSASAVSVVLLRQNYHNMDLDVTDAILESIDPSLHEMDEYKQVRTSVSRQMEVSVGKAYKDFGLPTPEGEILNVSDVHQGKVLLIDFWASWCNPCRQANPEVVALYEKYHEQGFEIIGVSLDSDREAWLKAIEDDNLTWQHISDVKGFMSEASQLYGIPFIPHTFIVDKEGIIRFKNLHGAEMDEAIASLL